MPLPIDRFSRTLMASLGNRAHLVASGQADAAIDGQEAVSATWRAVAARIATMQAEEARLLGL